jgi:hypothetical protein
LLEDYGKVLGQVTLYWYSTDEFIFGNFEVINKESGITLLRHIIQELNNTSEKFTIIGPINGSRFNRDKFKKSGNESSYLEPFNPHFYCDIVESIGFESFETYYSYYQEDLALFDNQIKEFTTLPEDITITNAEKYSIGEIIDKLAEISIKAFTSIDPRDGITKEDFMNNFPNLQYIINKKLTQFAFNKDNEPIGYFIACNNWTNYFKGKFNLIRKLKFLLIKNITKPKLAVIGKNLAVLPEYQNHSVAWNMVQKFSEIGKTEKLPAAIFTLTKENSPSHKMADRFCRQDREFKLYKYHSDKRR